jgi:5-deoxy-glucuronate isomerase
MTGSLYLPRGEATDELDPVAITPESAGWEFIGLRIIELPPGGRRRIATAGTEMAVLPLVGSCIVECDGAVFELGGRADVFSAVSDFAYAPIESEVTITATARGRFALPSARAARRLRPAYGAAHEVPVEVRGAGPATRQINNFLEPEVFPADRLMAVELLTPEGNWSSYPPHKHDEARPDEAQLEEIYYFEIAQLDRDRGVRTLGQGFGLHRVYTQDGAIDLTEEVGHGDVVLIPRGYHGPSAAAPGYDMYCLNVLAGPEGQRSMAFRDDPAHAWVRASWDQQEVDPRVPMTGARR